MDHCENCKWWRQRESFNWGQCEQENITNLVFAEPEDDWWDEYELNEDHYIVVTHRRFGCIFWEEV